MWSAERVRGADGAERGRGLNAPSAAASTLPFSQVGADARHGVVRLARGPLAHEARDVVELGLAFCYSGGEPLPFGVAGCCGLLAG